MIDAYQINESSLYVIDTSALILLDFNFPKSNPVFTAIWEEMEEMIQRSLLHTIDYVEMEINEYEGKETFLQSWVKLNKRQFVRPTSEECYITAIPIINAEYKTGFFDAKKLAAGKDEADPYLIAYAKVNKGILITNENFQKPNKIPQVAKKYGVQCLPVNEFIRERGLRMMRRKSEKS